MSTKAEFEIIYNEFRTHVLNKEYYAFRSQRVRRYLRGLDIFLALFAGGSGILSFAVWKATIFGVQVGPTLLALATGAAVVIAIARPYLKLEDELERISSVHGAYGAISYIMEDIVSGIKIKEQISDEEKTVYDVLRRVRGTLVQKEDVPADRELIAEVQAIVNQRHPSSSFYYPKE